jgi:NADH-quinone oxidoreductase subunit M
MLGTFLALDGVTFYIFWELMLIPMYFLIGVWGGARRIYAALKFVLYTALGSLLMLVAIVYLAYQTQQQLGAVSFYLGDWIRLSFSRQEEILLFSAFALAFAIKIPLFPLHTWLPDAHVEAPTGGSVILAGVLLKMGLYGLIRFCVPVFPLAAELSRPWFAVLAVVGIVFGALVAWVQTDMKKLVAYSSVSHLGFCVLGFAAMNREGLQGAIMQMLNHGVSTAALFFIVGVLYDRKHTREIAEYGGLATKLPMFATVFLIFTLSSVGLPLTNGFVGEFLILLGGYQYSPILGAIAVTGVVFGAMYMLSLYRRVVFGEFNEEKNGDLTDLTWTERLVFAPLIVLVFVMGLYPAPFLSRIEGATEVTLSYLEQAKQAQPQLAQSEHAGTAHHHH